LTKTDAEHAKKLRKIIFQCQNFVSRRIFYETFNRKTYVLGDRLVLSKKIVVSVFYPIIKANGGGAQEHHRRFNDYTFNKSSVITCEGGVKN